MAEEPPTYIGPIFGWSEHDLRAWYGTLPDDWERMPIVGEPRGPECEWCNDDGVVEACCGQYPEGCEGECRIRVPCPRCDPHGTNT